MVKKEAFGISIDLWANHCAPGHGRSHGGAVSGITWLRESTGAWALCSRGWSASVNLRWREKSWDMVARSRAYERPGRYRPIDRGK